MEIFQFLFVQFSKLFELSMTKTDLVWRPHAVFASASLLENKDSVFVYLRFPYFNCRCKAWEKQVIQTD